MSTLTKEWLQKTISELEEERDAVPGAVNEDAAMALEAMKLAMASIEAEPVAYIFKHPAGRLFWSLTDESNKGQSDVMPVYTASPAPVSVPDEVTAEDCPAFVKYDVTDVDEAWSRGFNACRAAMLQGADGNSPVNQDGWVACSERMPENDDFVYIWPRPDFGVELHVAQYGKFDKRGAGWYAQVYEQNYGIEYYPVKVTHWMPLPAAPQQEAKNV